MMPASAMKPIIEVAVKAAPSSQCPSTMPISVSGTGIRIDQRQQERAELRDDEQVDAEDRDPERRAHVAERDVGHLPFAVPKQGGLGIVDRLSMILDLRRAVLAPVHLGDRVLDREHAVDRRLEAPGDVRGHHFGEAAVMAEDRIRRWLPH